MPSRDQILKALEAVIDPELRSSIVELGMVRSIDIHDDGRVAVMVSLTTPGCPIRSHFQTGVANAVRELDGVSGVNVNFDVLSDNEKQALGRKLVPLTAHDGIKVMSIGFFVEQDAAVVWRGPMLHKALQQFLEDVDWGALDYLLIDLPPGTGDVSMTLAQLLPQAQFLIVTTPQPTAQKVARRAAEMARKVSLEIAGVIENMSWFQTPAGERFQIFGSGGGQELADELDVPLLGKVPLTMPLRAQSDAGMPLVLADPDDAASEAIAHVARGMIAMAAAQLPVLPLLEVAGAPGRPMQQPAGTQERKPAGMSLPMA